MARRTPQRPNITCSVLLLGLVLVASVNTSTAATPIYKCFDKNLGLLYTDEPCKDGEVVKIRAGDADPAAVARLERARDALDQSAAQRIVDQRRAAIERDLAGWYAGPGPRSAYEDAATNMTYTPFDYGVPWLYSGFAGAHPMRSRAPKQFQARHLALKPTPMTARR